MSKVHPRPARWWRRAVAVCFLGAALAGAARAQAPAPGPETAPPPRPAVDSPLGTQAMPIDLPTALRLANADNPTIAISRERLREAYIRLSEAQLYWLPDLTADTAYLRHDGRIQDVAGVVFNTSK